MVTRESDKVLTIAFLRGKPIRSAVTADYVAAVDRHIRAVTQESTTDAVKLADQFLARTKSLSPELRLIANRAAGWAYLVAGKYQQSKGAYLSARKLAGKDLVARGRIDRTLIDVFMYLGKPAEATRRARLAISTFTRTKSDDDLARTRVNYANVLHRQDQHLRANKLYHQAAEHFKAKGDQLALALCWYNEANTLVQLFDFKQAATLYADAKAIFEEKSYRLHAIGCLYGEAWLNMLAGNFHIALRDLAACEEFYRAGGMKRELVLCQLDRAESYLGLNLSLDARREAEAALAGAKKLGIEYEQAKAHFFAGRAAVGLGRRGDARRQLLLAATLFARQKNTGFAKAVQFDLSKLTGRTAAGTSHRVSGHIARTNQLPLWSAIRDIQIAAVQSDDATALSRLEHNPAVKLVPHLAAQRHTILGDRAAKRHQTTQAIREWSEAAEILDGVRAKLPPVELRSSFFGRSTVPFRKLIATESARDPMTAAVWAERFKTVGLWSPIDDSVLGFPARARIHENLAVLAGQVAAVVNQSGAAPHKRSVVGMTNPLSNEVLRRKLRVDQSSLYSAADGQVDSNLQIRDIIDQASRENTIVQFHVGDRDLYAFVHDHGDCRVLVFDGGMARLEQLLSRWRFLVEAAHGNRRSFRRDDLKEETRTLAALGEWLITPLELGGRDKRLVIVPEGRLSGVPWSALLVGNHHLYESHVITLTPSIRHFAASNARQIKSRRADLFVGSTSGLRSVQSEVEAIAAQLGGFDTQMHNPCRRADWPENSDARIWHFSGHAHLRADNPFYSSLQLADQPIFAEDFRLRRNRVELVTLAACRTGQQTSLPGDEAGGLVRALLEMGARTVVAGGWAVADKSTALWMEQFYRSYVDGSSAGLAGRSAMDSVKSKYPSAYHWAAFSLYGAY